MEVKDNEIELSEIVKPGSLVIPSAVSSVPYTKCAFIGNIRCYLPDSKGFPRFFIGPTWMFAIPILATVAGATYMLLSILYYLENTHYLLRSLGLLLLMVFLQSYFYTLLANPGIP